MRSTVGRRLVALVACGAVVVSVTALSVPAGAVAGFGDVGADRFFTEPVQWMVDDEITTGTSSTCFSPDDPVTRGQAAAFLWRIEGSPAGSPPHPFTDVVAPWQQTPVSWMFDEEITTGTSATTFSPDDTLTRGQMAALIHRAAGSPSAAPTTFPDVVRPWQSVPVGWMEAEEITTGTSATTFSPDDPVTRGQFATFAWRWKGRPAVVVDDSSPLCNGRDDFDGQVQAGWTIAYGTPQGQSLSLVPGRLAIAGGSAGEYQQLSREPVADEFEIETKLDFAPTTNFQIAGLTVDQDANDWIQLGRAYCDTAPPDCVGDGVYLDNITEGDFAGNAAVALPPGTGDVYLRLRFEAGTFTGWYSLDGTSWTLVGTVTRTLVAPTVGVSTGQSQGVTAPIALFDWFTEVAVP